MREILPDKDTDRAASELLFGRKARDETAKEGGDIREGGEGNSPVRSLLTGLTRFVGVILFSKLLISREEKDSLLLLYPTLLMVHRVLFHL